MKRGGNGDKVKKALVIGAGFSGCMPAMLLKEKGWSVTVIDKAGFIGGGVRTFFHGGHPFTYGPRHFLSPYPEAYEFLNKYVPLRHIKKINYTYVESDQAFYTYPIHEDDIDRMPEAKQIRKDLASLPEESYANNFEEFWIQRVGETLYSKFVKEYNKKAWLLKSNTEMDFGFEATVKRRPLESGERYEYKDWFNCYPIPHDGYNRFFDIALEGCEVLLNTEITGFGLGNTTLYIGDRKLKGDIIISTISPDTLMDYQFGELKYVGREFHKIVLPIEHAFPEDVYFIYYPNANDLHTRVVEYKKFTLHKSLHTFLGIEVPSLKNKLYPTMIQVEVDKAQKYIDALPENVFSVGRMGTYRYIDIDDIILQSMEFVKRL
jgi:UDP-galactopyranose mutase